MDDDVIALEERRCAAIGLRDLSALREILSEDYVHVHATGKIDDLAGHLEAVSFRPRTPERANLKVRYYGDTAVLVGEQINRVGDTVSAGVATQVAVRLGDAWRFVSMQVTRQGAAA